MKPITTAFLAYLTLAASAQAQVSPTPLSEHVGGRTVTGITMRAIPGAKPQPMRLYPGRSITPTQMVVSHTHQWPGIYTEVAFEGTDLIVRLNDPVNILRLYIDDQPPVTLTKPGQIDYEVKGLQPGAHRIRLEKITESQSDTAKFEGFYIVGHGHELPAPPPRLRQIEFIGDSFTVGYGNTSPKRECTTDEVWATTDTSQAFGPLTAKAYNADYQINAFSGRGVVRNYDGFAGDTLPTLHNYTLFDGKTEYKATNWQPQIIVIGLGTNDFSTALKPTEPWKTREDLRADYRNSYVKFVKTLRAKNPKAQFILMASDQSDGEIRDQVLQVEKSLESQGETKVDTIIFTGLDYAGCHAHPSVADDLKLKSLLTDYIDARPALWQGR